MTKVELVLINSLGGRLDEYECPAETAATTLRELLRDRWSVLNPGDCIEIREVEEG